MGDEYIEGTIQEEVAFDSGEIDSNVRGCAVCANANASGSRVLVACVLKT